MNEEKILKLWEVYGKKSKDEYYPLDAFRSGIQAYELYIAKTKAMKETRKSGSLVLEDFLSNDKDFQMLRHFMDGVHYSEGKGIITDGHFLVMHDAEYSEDLEGKTIRDGKTKEGDYPNYKKVIPSEDNLKTTDAFTLEDLKIIATVDKSKSHAKQSKVFVKIADDLGFSLKIIKHVIRFWTSYPDAVLKCDKKDCEKSWVVDAGKDNKIVFMPLYSSVKYDWVYDKKTKVCSKVVEE